MRTSFALLISILFLASCTEQKAETKRSLLDYILVPDAGLSSEREFIKNTDSTIARLFLSEKHKQINDSAWEFEFFWSNQDSILVSSSKEIYRPDGSTILSESFYELDSLQNTLEAVASFSGNRNFMLNKDVNPFRFQYTYRTEPPLTMKVESYWSSKFEQIDSLGVTGKDCLVITSNDRATVDYSGDKKDTTMSFTSIRIYSKGHGLIRFGTQNGSRLSWYKLRPSLVLKK